MGGLLDILGELIDLKTFPRMGEEGGCETPSTLRKKYSRERREFLFPGGRGGTEDVFLRPRGSHQKPKWQVEGRRKKTDNFPGRSVGRMKKNLTGQTTLRVNHKPTYDKDRSSWDKEGGIEVVNLIITSGKETGGP